MSPPRDDFYVTGGALGAKAESYVSRPSDQQLYDALTRGEYCYVLTPSQMGKTSLMARTAARFSAEGIAVIRIDLTAIGDASDAEQWYYSLLFKVGQDLGLKDALRAYWREHAELGPIPRWMGALRDVVLPGVTGRIVIFIDEIGVVTQLPFAPDAFFAAVRACYQRREEDPELGRLTFCLLGVATPSELIRDPRSTAFNLGRRIDLFDFSETEAATLAEGLGRDPRLAAQLLKRILYWTGGHPYLTQRLCRAVAEDLTVRGPSGVDRICEQLFLGRDVRDREANLKEVERQVLQRGGDVARVLDLYRRVRRWQLVRVPADARHANRSGVLNRLKALRVRHDTNDPVADILRISGITRVFEGYLWVRNRIYYFVFDSRWIKANIPDLERRRQRAAFFRGLATAAAIAVPVIALIIWLGAQAYWNRKWAMANDDAAEAVLTATHDTLKPLKTNAFDAASHLRLNLIPSKPVRVLSTTLVNGGLNLILKVGFQKTVEKLNKLEANHKETMLFNRVVSAMQHDIGDVEYFRGDFQNAVESYRKAVDHQRHACTIADRDFPFIYRHTYGKIKLATFQEGLNEYYAHLIRTLLRLGRTSDAAAALRERREQCRGEPRLLYTLARALARPMPLQDWNNPKERPFEPAEHRQLDDMIIQALQLAVDAGYDDLSSLRDDPDFEDLRPRQDFRTLIGRR